MCHKNSICYEVKCKVCENSYFGETSRNLYTRGREHVKKLEKKDVSSFMQKHQNEVHNGEPVQFEMRVVKSFKDPLSRQITEAVLIKNAGAGVLNSKAEFHQPPLVTIRSEIVRGLQDD